MASLEILHADFNIPGGYFVPVIHEGRHDRFFDHHPQIRTGETFGLLGNGIKVTLTLDQGSDGTQDVPPRIARSGMGGNSTTSSKRRHAASSSSAG